MRTVLRVTNTEPVLKKKQRQLLRLFMDQGGLCYYCKEPMALKFAPPPRHQPEDPRRATIEHLDDKFSPMRGKYPPGTVRHVAACHECNVKRGRENMSAQPIEVLRNLSGRWPVDRIWIKYTRSQKRAIRDLGHRIYQRAFSAMLAREEDQSRELYLLSEELDKIAGMKWRHRPGQVTEFSRLLERRNTFSSSASA